MIFGGTLFLGDIAKPHNFYLGFPVASTNIRRSLFGLNMPIDNAFCLARYVSAPNSMHEEVSKEFDRTRKAFTKAIKSFIVLLELDYKSIFKCDCKVRLMCSTSATIYATSSISHTFAHLSLPPFLILLPIILLCLILDVLHLHTPRRNSFKAMALESHF